MAEQQIRFDDGGAYEKSMGVWSGLAGSVFLDWLAPAPGIRWLDVGCGSGAFTELVIQHCAPSAVHGIDPSEGQLAFARTRPAAQIAEFSQGNAMALPFGDATFDAVVMALVLFFVPDPAKGVAEMARVVCPGGLAGAYLWDFESGGFPFEPIQAEMRAVGIKPPVPPRVETSRIDVLRDLWAGAGFTDIETRAITVSRGFANFDEFWTVTTAGSAIRPILDGMSVDDAEQLRARVGGRLQTDAAGRVSYQSTANAIKGRAPA